MKTKILLIISTVFFLCNGQSVNAQGGTLPLNGSANANISTVGQADWWTVTTNADGKLSFTLTNSGSSDFYAQLYANDQTTALSGGVEAWSGTNNTATGTVDGLAVGTYKIKVFPFSTSTGTYSISNTLTTLTQANDAEPNNYAKQALTLPLNGNKGGHLDYNNYAGSVDFADWYKVTTNADGRLRITLTNSNITNADFYIALYAGDTTSQISGGVEAWNGTGNTAVLTVDGLSASTYYIKIFPFSTTFGSYTIADSLFTPSQTNDVEPNNYAVQAITLPLNGSTGGHLDYNNGFSNGYRDFADWYKVTLNSDGYLRVTLNTNVGGNNTGADFYMTVYDKDSVIVRGNVESWAGTSNAGVLKLDGLSAGQYFVKIYPFSTSFGTYTISDSLYPYINDPEPNNAAYQATTIQSNGTVGGHLNFATDGSSDPVDWWKINYTGTNGNMTLVLKQLPYGSNGSSVGDAYMAVYKDTLAGAIYNGEAWGGNNPLTANLTGLTQGYYWIKVYPFGSSFSSYSISDSYTETVPGVAATTGTDTVADCSSTNTLVYKFTKVAPPFTVQLYRFGVAYGTPKSVTAKKLTIKNLPDGAYFAVATADGASVSGTSKTIGIMPKPTSTSTTNITGTQATVNWAVQSCAKYYSVQYRASSATTWTTKKTAGNVASYVIKGLTVSTQYYWKVAAVDSANTILATSAATDSLTFTTAAAFANAQSLEHVIAGTTISDNSNLLIYPNPAKSLFTIQFASAKPDTKITALLKDMYGKTIWMFNSTASALNGTKIDVSKLANGIYILQVTDLSNNTIITKKVVVSN